MLSVCSGALALKIQYVKFRWIRRISQQKSHIIFNNQSYCVYIALQYLQKEHIISTGFVMLYHHVPPAPENRDFLIYSGQNATLNCITHTVITRCQGGVTGNTVKEDTKVQFSSHEGSRDVSNFSYNHLSYSEALLDNVMIQNKYVNICWGFFLSILTCYFPHLNCSSFFPP